MKSSVFFFEKVNFENKTIAADETRNYTKPYTVKRQHEVCQYRTLLIFLEICMLRIKFKLYLFNIYIYLFDLLFIPIYPNFFAVLYSCARHCVHVVLVLPMKASGHDEKDVYWDVEHHLKEANTFPYLY